MSFSAEVKEELMEIRNLAKKEEVKAEFARVYDKWKYDDKSLYSKTSYREFSKCTEINTAT